MSDQADEKELAAAFRIVAGRAILRSAVQAWKDLGIVPVVLKGILLSALAEGTGRPPRPMSDVDVLVPGPARAAARAALLGRGWTHRAQVETADTLTDPALGFDLDLHSELSDAFLFRFSGGDVIARSRVDTALFGFPVRRPADEDVYAHLVVHFVRNRSNAQDRRHVADFALAADLLGLEADRVAAHLLKTGLARAARYALSLAVHAGDTFAARVIEALPFDPMGAVLSRGAEQWLRRYAGNDTRAAPVPHLLNASLIRGCLSFGARTQSALEARFKRR